MPNSTEPTNQLAAALLRLDELRSRGDLSPKQFRALVDGLLDVSTPEPSSDEPDGADDNDELSHSSRRLADNGAHSNTRSRLTTALAVLAACALLIAILSLIEAKNARSELREHKVELEQLSGTLDRRSDQLQDISDRLLTIDTDLSTLETNTLGVPEVITAVLALRECVADYQSAIEDFIDGGLESLTWTRC